MDDNLRLLDFQEWLLYGHELVTTYFFVWKYFLSFYGVDDPGSISGKVKKFLS
jgi:hypothetical protein